LQYQIFQVIKNGPSHQELKLAVSEEKKRKNLAVLAKTPRLKRFFQQRF